MSRRPVIVWKRITADRCEEIRAAAGELLVDAPRGFLGGPPLGERMCASTKKIMPIYRADIRAPCGCCCYDSVSGLTVQEFRDALAQTFKSAGDVTLN